MNIETLEKSKRDGGGFGKFRNMTLEEAATVPHGAYIWVRMRSGLTEEWMAQAFRTYNPTEINGL